MKPKMKITEQDYLIAVRRANRELEIELHGKQVSMRGGRVHKSKKAYDRKKLKSLALDLQVIKCNQITLRYG